jgi:outer membrane protein assembly factor BamB
MRRADSINAVSVRGWMTGVVIAVACSDASWAGDWPQWLGPARNGTTPETVTPWDAPPEAVWRKEIGGGFSAPVVSEGVVYVHAQVAGKEAEEVIAFDAKTGEERWRKSYERAKYRSELGAGPRATPIVAEGGIYTFGITGVLSCFDVKDGNLKWQVNPYDEFKSPQPGFGVCASPIVVDGRVVLPLGGTGHAVVAYDAATGKVAWNILDEPAGTASPVALLRGDGKNNEVLVQTTLRLVSVNPADGEIRWEHPLVFQPSGVAPTPLAFGDMLVCSTQDTGTLTLELPTGSDTQPHQKWWKQDLGSYFSSGTLDGKGRVFVISNELMPLPRADVHCLDIATGEQAWVQKGLGYFHVGLVATGDGKLLLLDDAGVLTLANPLADKLEVICKAKVCGGTFVNPALANGHLYVRDGKELVCLKLPPEKERAAAAGGDE